LPRDGAAAKIQRMRVLVFVVLPLCALVVAAYLLFGLGGALVLSVLLVAAIVAVWGEQHGVWAQPVIDWDDYYEEELEDEEVVVAPWALRLRALRATLLVLLVSLFGLALALIIPVGTDALSPAQGWGLRASVLGATALVALSVLPRTSTRRFFWSGIGVLVGGHALVLAVSALA
jgi:hypothetical protein